VPNVEIVESAGAPATPTYPVASCIVSGTFASRLVRPGSFGLWAVVTDANAGTELRWGGDHGDEALYVLSGAVELDGVCCRAEDAVIIESGVRSTLRVVDEMACFIHFGSTASDAVEGPLGAPSTEGRGTHVVRRSSCAALAGGTLYYADSDCPTCRVTLLSNRREAAHRSPSHSHSADELIYIVSGSIRIGSATLTAGDAVAIRGGHRYGFSSDDAFAFLNYRADASLYTGHPGDEPILETIAAMTPRGL
jgi:redox-sensitive bicupin YhaK (pirin superfamily)